MKPGEQYGWMVTSSAEPLAQVHTKAMDVTLLTSTADQEVMRYDVQPGAVIGIGPREGADATEVYLILEGELACESDGPATVRAGEVLVPTSGAQGLLFRAMRPTVLLAISSQPVFHAVYGGVDDLRRLAREVARKDGYTHDHCARVRRMAFDVGRIMGLTPDRLYWLMFGAYLHDVGKVRVPGEILQKPGPLTPDEWAVMRQHPGLGAEMVAATQAARAAVIVGQHHERIDGSGYPQGLKGDAILVESQIVAVVDAYDAITTDRPYHRAEAPEAALAELRRCGGRLFREDVVEAFAVWYERQAVRDTVSDSDEA